MSRIVHLLATKSGLREVDVRRIMHTAPIRYKTYFIPKRDGRLREISQPASEVKLLQRVFMENFLNTLPIHPCATAYRSGVALVDNVRPHQNAGPILKMDLKEFFPSIKKNDWFRYCAETKCLVDPQDVHLTGNLLFHRKKRSPIFRLAIGAPSSPMLSNILMFSFDTEVTNKVRPENVTYTRYADDLTFSAPRTGFLTGVQKYVAQTIRTIRYPSLEINPEKTVQATKRYRRVVTGLVITNDGQVTIGRDRKRWLHVALHHAKTGELSEAEWEQLEGWLGYVSSVEPAFLNVLSKRYGDAIVSDIRTKSPRRKFKNIRGEWVKDISNG